MGDWLRHTFYIDPDFSQPCSICHQPIVPGGPLGDSFCERCGLPMHFDCHQERATSPAEKLATQQWLEDVNAPRPMVDVVINDELVVTVPEGAIPADDVCLIQLCLGCRS